MKNWAITVRKHAKSEDVVTEADYRPYIDMLGNLLQFHVFEHDKKKEHVHLHGVVKLPSNYYRKKLRMEGFNMLLKEITDYKGWINYCRKDKLFRSKLQFDLAIQDHESDIEKGERTSPDSDSEIEDI